MSEKTQAEIAAERIIIGNTAVMRPEQVKAVRKIEKGRFIVVTSIVQHAIDTATAGLRAEKEALLDMLQKAMGAECFECHGRVGRENYPDASIRLFHEPDCKVGELLKANGRGGG